MRVSVADMVMRVSMALVMVMVMVVLAVMVSVVVLVMVDVWAIYIVLKVAMDTRTVMHGTVTHGHGTRIARCFYSINIKKIELC